MYRFEEMYRLILIVTTISIVVNAFEVSQIFTDLTHAFDENTLEYPITTNPSIPFQLTVNTYNPNGQKVTSEEYSGSTRAVTHIVSPSHFYPGTASVDQLSLDKLIGPAAVVVIDDKASEDSDAEVTVENLEQWELITGQSLNGTIVLMSSTWSAKYSNKTAYFGTAMNDSRTLHFPEFSPEAAKWLVENRTVKGIGIDTLAIDRGISTDYQSHRILSKAGIYILENVANLDSIPIYGAIVYVMPMKITGASGAPVRILATYPGLRCGKYG